MQIFPTQIWTILHLKNYLKENHWSDWSGIFCAWSLHPFDREIPPISFRAVKVVCLVDTELAVPGNLDLVRVDEGDDDLYN